MIKMAIATLVGCWQLPWCFLKKQNLEALPKASLTISEAVYYSKSMLLQPLIQPVCYTMPSSLISWQAHPEGMVFRGCLRKPLGWTGSRSWTLLCLMAIPLPRHQWSADAASLTITVILFSTMTLPCFSANECTSSTA